MNTTKLALGTLVGGVSLFFLGWLVYGIALRGYFEAHEGTAIGVSREEDMIWWALILGNLAYGLLYTYIFLQWAGISTFAGGARAGAVLGVLTALGYDLISYSMSNLIDGPMPILVDSIAWAFMSALAGGLIGLVLGRGNG